MNDNQKGTSLEGAETDEVLESASNILTPTVRGGQKGLQQFYTPEPVAKFVAEMLERKAALDLTAGDGSLLQFFPEGQRYGVEIDKEQIARGKYVGIQGDVQHIAPLLQEINASFPRMALNPPFGLKWTDPTINEGRETNSALVTLHYGARLLNEDGGGVLITGGDGGYDKLLAEAIAEMEPFGEGYYARKLVVYAVISCPDIWAETRVGNDIILFGFQRVRREHDFTVARFEKQVEELNDPTFIATLKRIRQESGIYYSTHDYYHDSKEREMWCRATQQEYDRRRIQREKPRKMDLDVWGEHGRIIVRPRPFVNIKLAGSHALDSITHLNKQPLTHFAADKKAWEHLIEMEEQGTLIIEAKLKPQVEAIIAETELEMVPMVPLKPQQRLAYLEDVEKIECTVAHERNGRVFNVGEEYPISVKPIRVNWVEKNRPVLNKDGQHDVADFQLQKWVLEIRIAGCRYVEEKDDIEFLIGHFKVPDPGTLDERYPEEIAAANTILDEIEGEMKTQKRLKPFQRQHLARLIVKKRGLLAHEQGLGKTLQGLTFAKAMVKIGAEDKVLIVAPQDLIPQWQKEAKDWYGQELVHLKRHDEKKSDFIKAARHLENGGSGWYITHYEALSRVGKKEAVFPLTMRVGHRRKHMDAHREWVYNAEKGHGEYVEHPEATWYEDITRQEACPNCGTSYRNGYDPNGTCQGRLPHSRIPGDEDRHEYSSICGWTPYSIRRKAPYSVIKGAFKDGVLIIDELTQIKGESQRSLAIRGIRAKHVLGMTGTPIKNYAPDAYWGLWKCLGDSTPRFPFHYKEGKERFESRFTTTEWKLDAYGRKGTMKRLPEVSNISRLWKLLAPNVARLRKEESGEELVQRTFYPTFVPCGAIQRRVTELWLRGFADFFKEMNPDHRLVIKGLHEWMAPMLGMQWKLEWAATMPEADPHKGYWVEKGKTDSPSNWTPKNTRVLELAMHHAAQGDKVLIGSAIKAPGRWLHDELNKRGVKAINILAQTEDEDDLKTLPPAKRAKIVQEFQHGDAQVLVSSHALNLGHNLDKGSVVILTGLPWDYATFDQFIARVHRLTSEREVKVYVVLAAGTIDERKWKLIVDKSTAANLALDGRLIEETEERINEAEIIKQMIEAGIPVQGNEVLESELEEAWAKIESADDLPELVLEGGVTDLTELQEEEGDDADLREGEDSEEGSAPAGDDEGAVEEAPEAGPEEEAAEVTPYIVVAGRGTTAELEAYLYSGYNELELCQEFSTTGRVVALIKSDNHAGFGAEQQAARIASSGSMSAVHFINRELALPQWEAMHSIARMAEDKAVADATSPEVPSEEPLPHPDTITAEEAHAIIEAEEHEKILVETIDPDADDSEPDVAFIEKIEAQDAELVTVGASEPDDDYFAGF